MSRAPATKETERQGAARDDEEMDADEADLGAPDPPAVEVRWPLNIVKAERTIFELHRQWQSGYLRLSPDYQRDFVWSTEQQMRLVESVMARIPLPVFYLSEESEDELLVVDGQQRLTTLFAFMEGWLPDSRYDDVIRRREQPGGKPFELRELRLMPELNRSTFKTLDAKMQRRFENTPLTCFIIQKGTHESVKYELFGRLNQGVRALNPQEMRNALDRGPGLAMVKELAREGSRFREVAGADRSYDRGRAQELVLRGLAFLWRGDPDYKGDLQLFLNETLRLLNRATDAERDDLRGRFLHALDSIQQVFGDQSFRRYDPDYARWAVHVSGPLVEVQIAGLGDAPSLDAQEAEALRARFITLCRDYSFQNSILNATQTKKNLELRLNKFTEIVAVSVPHPPTPAAPRRRSGVVKSSKVG